MVAKALLAVQQGTVLSNQQIANTRYGTAQQTPADQPFHPHLVDVYIPTGAVNVALMSLHGGGGSKVSQAAQLRVLTQGAVNWKLLKQLHCAVWIPSGQHCAGVDAAWGAGNNPWNPGVPGVVAADVNTVSADYPAGIGGWSSHAFWSGYDDPQFLRDAPAAMAAQHSGAYRVLHGHSEGGIMTNRAWVEHSGASWNAYLGSSAPMSKWHLDNNATAPAGTVKPWRGQFGLLDENLGIYPTNKFQAATWQQPETTTLSQATFPVVVWIGDYVQLQARVNAYNVAKGRAAETVSMADVVTTPVASGNRFDLIYCGGAMQLTWYDMADHSQTTQQRAAGSFILVDMVQWALAHAE